MRNNWKMIRSYYQELIENDVYPQHQDDQHTEWAVQAIEKWMPQLVNDGCKSVLDVGCGVAFTQDIFEMYAVEYKGITLGSDFLAAKGKSVYKADFNFIPDSILGLPDLIFSRHSLEHSPFPLLTLMEWHRVSKRWLILVMPNPEKWTYLGRNHYSVMQHQTIRWMLRRAGWKVIDKDHNDFELRYLCEKFSRISYEGYVEVPLKVKIYENDRDDTLSEGEL